MCACVYNEKGCSLSFFIQFKRAAAHLHDECRPESLVESPRRSGEAKAPGSDEKSLLTHDTAACVEADEEEEEERSRGGDPRVVRPRPSSSVQQTDVFSRLFQTPGIALCSWSLTPLSGSEPFTCTVVLVNVHGSVTR